MKKVKETSIKKNTSIEQPAKEPKTLSKSIIYAVKINKIDLKIEGLTGLICHRYTEASQKRIEDKLFGNASSLTNNRTTRFPEQEREDACYKTKDGDYGFPAEGFRKSFIAAATFIGKAFSKVALKGLIKIITPEGLVKINYTSITPRSDKVKIGIDGLDMRYRNQFDGWSCTLPIIYNASSITSDQIVQLFEYAGFHVGVGDWRPISPKSSGQFGTFRVARAEMAE